MRAKIIFVHVYEYIHAFSTHAFKSTRTEMHCGHFHLCLQLHLCLSHIITFRNNLIYLSNLPFTENVPFTNNINTTCILVPLTQQQIYSEQNRN